MGRIEKQKRKHIEESNKRVLNIINEEVSYKNLFDVKKLEDTSNVDDLIDRWKSTMKIPGILNSVDVNYLLGIQKELRKIFIYNFVSGISKNATKDVIKSSYNAAIGKAYTNDRIVKSMGELTKRTLNGLPRSVKLLAKSAWKFTFDSTIKTSIKNAISELIYNDFLAVDESYTKQLEDYIPLWRSAKSEIEDELWGSYEDTSSTSKYNINTTVDGVFDSMDKVL